MSVNLQKFIQANGLSMRSAAEAAGCDKSVIVKVCNQTYYEWQRKEAEIIALLQEKGHTKMPSDQLTISTDVLVKTSNVDRFFQLADSLADPDGSLTSSLGMVIGTAERGKTYAARHYASKNPNAVYIQFIEGSSRCQVLRSICYQLTGCRPYSFGACVSALEEISRLGRRLVIVDEADKCPLSILEMLRGVNEVCHLPFLFVGEEALKGKMDAVPRLRSRVRNPIVVFDPLAISDVSVYWSMAAGLSLDQAMLEKLFRRARAGFRTLSNDALALVRIANASGINTITPAMLDTLGA